MKKKCLGVPGNNTGTLYVAALPIGNIQDITARVLEMLTKVDYVLAEDTRFAIRLFEHFKIKVTLISYHDFSSSQKRVNIIQDLLSGKKIMLTCEAGTPTISDPGYKLIHCAWQNKITVIPLPGVSAAICALSVSGLPTDNFFFAGFLQRKQKKVNQLIDLLNKKETIIVYEAPGRLIDTLKQIAQIDPTREIFIGREMTKTYEQYLHGPVSDIIQKLDTVKGEIVLIIAGNKSLQDESLLNKLIDELLNKKISDRDILDIATNTFSVKRNKVRQIISGYARM